MFGDYIEMEEPSILKEWNVKVYRKGIYIAKDVKDARNNLRKAKAIFTPEVDAPFLSLCKQNDVMVGFLTRWIEESNIRHYMKWVKLVKAYHVPILIGSGAKTLKELRSPQDRAAIGVFLGMDQNDAFMSVHRRWHALETR